MKTKMRLLLVLALAAAAQAILPAATGADGLGTQQCNEGQSRELGARANDSTWDLTATATDQGCGRPPTGSSSTGSDETTPSTVITSTEACEPIRATGVVNIAIACIGQANLDLQACDPDLGFEVSPTTIQTLQPDGTYSAPDLNTVLTCNRAPGAAPVVVTEADFRTLQLTPSAIVVGPTQGWLPVNMITVVYTDAEPQVITTTLLGQPVTVRATPTTFVWDWADGSPPTTTTDPGAPWPNHTVSYTYPQTGDYTVTMTTTWTGEYSLDGGTTYTPITGTASTVSTAPPLTVKELRSHLVEDPIG